MSLWSKVFAFNSITRSIQAGQILLGANKMSKSVADLDMPAKIQFMLTLVKLWKNFQYEDISVRFACQQQKHASQIFKVRTFLLSLLDFANFKNQDEYAFLCRLKPRLLNFEHSETKISASSYFIPDNF